MRMVTENSCSLLKYWMDISQLWWTSTKVIPTGKTLAGNISVVLTLSTYFLQRWVSSAFPWISAFFFHCFLYIIIVLKLLLLASLKGQNLKILRDTALGSLWGAYSIVNPPPAGFFALFTRSIHRLAALNLAFLFFVFFIPLPWCLFLVPIALQHSPFLACSQNSPSYRLYPTVQSI